MSTTTPKSGRGFGGMDSNKQREIAKRGGQRAHELGTAHEFTADEAREAGKAGGKKISADKEHMRRIGRMGGAASRKGRKTAQPAAEATVPSAEGSAGET